ncbi:hypothetical protein [Paraliobacillus sp. X-1268]|uniref:hypothetical protein n=1 Tax=Paraliobacillus sp. X-1268 TaxID=2213193 RepID=UPI000E3CBE0A|nr:hypothetical protein [Paraliobacillus sp. X-1268]
MKQIYAFESKEDFDKYKGVIDRFLERLAEYQLELEEKFALKDLPKGIVWTTEELATNVFSDIPIPAFTNKDIIYISPDISAWRDLFVQQLEDRKKPRIKKYYESLSENHLFTILGHELTHHSDLFVDDFDEEREDGIWFEEGMCEYLPRKVILDQVEFNEITNVELELVRMFKEKYGNHSLDAFGIASYQGSLTSIMFDYWRSFLAVKFLVEERSNNDIQQVFKEYHNWHNEGRK